MAKNESSKSKKQNKLRLKNDPSYERTRENIAEFTVAMKAGKLIRSSFRGLIKTTAASSRSVVGRMQQMLMQILKSDSTSIRGSRQVSKGDLSKFYKFDFNEKAAFDINMSGRFSNTADRVSGKLIVEFLPFIPAMALAVPIGTTHFKLLTAAAEYDFEKEEYWQNEVKTDYLPYNKVELAPFSLEVSITPGSKQACLQVLGVEFYQEVNGEMYLLKDDTHSALRVIWAESAVA